MKVNISNIIVSINKNQEKEIYKQVIAESDKCYEKNKTEYCNRE